MSRRYAIYYAPPEGDPLAVFGDRWLGRRAVDARPVADRLCLPGMDAAAMADLTAFPAHYGFHATLRAPFELADGWGEADLADLLARLAAGLDRFALPLTIGRLGRFLALVPAGDSAAIDRLAATVLEAMEPARRPLSPEDRARRLKSPLEAREVELLDGYGYPYVLDRFRFHMTLTGPQDGDFLDRIRPALDDLIGDLLDRPAPVTDLTVYTQADRDRPFTIHSRYPLGRFA